MMPNDNPKNTHNPSDPAFHDAWQKLGKFHPRRFVFWTLHKAASPFAVWWLAVISFFEAIFFPVPADVLLVPMGIAQRNRVFFFAILATVTNVLGGAVSWFIGAYAFATISNEIITFFGLRDSASLMITAFQTNGPEIILIGAFTPIPFKLIAMISGLSSVSLSTFVIYAALGRILRFGILAIVLYFANNQIRWLLFRHFGWLMFSLLTIILLTLYAWRHYIPFPHV